MPSRKRMKGKARKVKKQLLETQKAVDFYVGCSSSLGCRTSLGCCHGWLFDDDQQIRDEQQRFVVTFSNALVSLRGSLGFVDVESQLPHGTRRMAMVKQFSDEWLNDFREIVEFDLECCLSYLKAMGTHSLLDSTTSSIETACDFALYSLMLRLKFGGGTLEDSGALQRKLRDLVRGSERDIVRFFYSSSKCACLKDRYKEVKKQPKIGYCYHCQDQKERKDLKVCAGCRLSQYCSRSCQRCAWPTHKSSCEELCKSQDSL